MRSVTGRRHRTQSILKLTFHLFSLILNPVAIKDARGHLVRMFICQCDCGNEKVFRYGSLLSGWINSWGCTRFPKKPLVDLTGRKFGRLTVVSEAERFIRKSGAKVRRWNCICECGRITIVLHNNLTSPHGVRSCGCSTGHFGKDLTGNRYGRLTVLSQATPYFRSNGYAERTWLCRCDCGRETIIKEWNLISGHTRSCGCLKYDQIKDHKYGLLTPVSRAPSQGGMRYWNCKCDCGNEIIVSEDDLFWGSVTDCGCLRRKELINLTGQRFGRLTAVREVEPIFSSGRSRRAWLCRCDCGHEVIVRQKNLISKVTRSCGCLRRKKRIHNP